jgi:hypothetical protein
LFQIDFYIVAWTTDPLERVMIAFITTSISQVRLPAGNDTTSSLNLIAHIRDTSDCVTEIAMASVIVVPDFARIDTFVTDLQQYLGNKTTTNPFIEMLTSGNPNAVGQAITSLAEMLNKNNSRNVDVAFESECNISF